jgi:DNA polymerase sigma
MIGITLKTKDHFGLKCVKLINTFLKKYESLEPLLFPLKTILKVGELNDPYNGGLSSYALILMIVNFLEYQKKMNKNISLDNIGDLFYDFLFFYGGRMDTNHIDINNINDNMKINKTPFIFIADPLNNKNNVAKTSYKYIEVKFIFLIALQILNEPCFCQCHYNKKDNTKDKEEHNLLNKIFFGIKRGKFNNFPLNK